MVRWMGPIKPREEGIRLVEKKKEPISANYLLFLSSTSFFLSLLFLSQNITGNVVVGFSTNGANWIGAVLFISAIIGFLIYTRLKK